MFYTDDFYGQRRILADYVGLDHTPPVLAHLQHGWNAFEGFGRRYLEDRVKDSRLPTLVWADHNLRLSKELGLRNVSAVGAPFLYLESMLQPRLTHRGTGTIVYPLHSGHDLSASRTGEAEFVQEVMDREPGPVTFCLYWREHDDPAIRQRYEVDGATVTTHGDRGHPLFLHRQREALLSHAKVVSNRVSTALFYGGIMGLDLAVYGPVFGSGQKDEVGYYEAVQHERWPEFVDRVVTGDEALAVSRRELGFNHLRSPDELADLLGWTGWRRATGPIVNAGTQVWRRVRHGRNP